MDGGDVLALAIDPTTTPSTLYAGTYEAGVFISVNGGTSWSVANIGLTAANIKSLAIGPNATDTLYAGTFGGGVFKGQRAHSVLLPVVTR